MRAILAASGIIFLAACSADRDSDSQFSGEAARVAAQQAKERCAAEGKRAELRGTYQNTDGSRRYEYQCVQ